MRFLIVVGWILLLLTAVTRVEAEDTDDITDVLMAGHWVADLGRGVAPEMYVYTFFKNGSCTMLHLTDYNTAPVPGRWSPIKDRHGKVCIVLDIKDPERSLLPPQTDPIFLRYERQKDVMLIWCEGYRCGGESTLRHLKAGESPYIGYREDGSHSKP